MKAKQKSVLIVDSFLLFCNEALSELCTKRIFIVVPKQVAYERRMNTKAVPEDYFQRVIWPGFVKSNAHLREQSREIVFLDGTANAEDILNAAIRYIKGEKIEPESALSSADKIPTE